MGLDHRIEAQHPQIWLGNDDKVHLQKSALALQGSTDFTFHGAFFEDLPLLKLLLAAPETQFYLNSCSLSIKGKRE